MDDIILKSAENFYKSQKERILKLQRKKYPGLNIEGRQYAQIINCLNIIYDKKHTDEELVDIITDGDGDGGLTDAFIFTKDSVDIFDFKEGDNLKLRDIQKLRHRIDSLLTNKPDSFKSDDIVRIKEHLKKYHSPRNSRGNLNIYIIRRKFSPLSADIKREISLIKKIPSAKVITLANKEIIDLLLKHELLENWLIKKSSITELNKKHRIIKKEKEYDYIIIEIPLYDLLNVYSLHLREHKDLFAQNIRLPYKQDKFQVDISDTIKENTDNFFIFHNGITITAKRIYDNLRNYYICEPQVVNGAQTIGNLFNYYVDDLKNRQLKKAKVICKIVKADQNLTDKICETSNTQKAVKTEELRVNDSFQKKIEIYINCESLGKYEYIRKGKKQEKKSIGIKYPLFFQWVYASLLKKPDIAKNAKRLLFERTDRGEYENIKKVIENNINKVISLCDIGIFIEKNIKIEKNKNKKNFLRIANLHIIAAMFKLSSCRKEDLNKIYKILKKYSLKEIKKGRNLNYIFTKTNLTWIYLNSKV